MKQASLQLETNKVYFVADEQTIEKTLEICYLIYSFYM
jgi:hypothetical protein